MSMNVSLPDELDAFVRARVSTGRYGSADEVVHEALRLMERHEQAEAIKLKWLQDAYQEGIASGDAGELDFAALKAAARARLGEAAK